MEQANYDLLSLKLDEILADPCPLGDVNLDGAIDFFDISPFISLLTSQSYQHEADIDQNNVVNFFDISPFIAVLNAP